MAGLSTLRIGQGGTLSGVGDEVDFAARYCYENRLVRMPETFQSRAVTLPPRTVSNRGFREAALSCHKSTVRASAAQMLGHMRTTLGISGTSER